MGALFAPEPLREQSRLQLPRDPCPTWPFPLADLVPLCLHVAPSSSLRKPRPPYPHLWLCRWGTRPKTTPLNLLFLLPGTQFFRTSRVQLSVVYLHISSVYPAEAHPRARAGEPPPLAFLTRLWSVTPHNRPLPETPWILSLCPAGVPIADKLPNPFTTLSQHLESAWRLVGMQFI